MRHIFTSHFLKTTVMESVLFPGGLIWVIYSTVKKRELFPGVFEGKEDIVAKILVFVAFVMVIVNYLVPAYRIFHILTIMSFAIWREYLKVIQRKGLKGGII